MPLARSFVRRIRFALDVMGQRNVEDRLPVATWIDNQLRRTACAARDFAGAVAHDLPIAIAGHGKPLCNLYLSMLHRLGIREESFGDRTGPLPGLG